MSATELRDNLAGELTADGFEVLVADSVAGIEARAVSAVPDLLVIGELDEPGLACEVVRGLRDGRLMDGRADPALPCVAITVDDRLTTLLRFFDAGSDDVVSLPLRYPELLARVRAVLRRRIEPASAGRWPVEMRRAKNARLKTHRRSGWSGSSAAMPG